MKRGAAVSQTVVNAAVSPSLILNTNGSSAVAHGTALLNGTNDPLLVKSTLGDRGVPSLAPLNGPLPALLPTLSMPLQHLEPGGLVMERQIEPITKDPGKNGIIAPITVLRPRADSFEVAKKDAIPVFPDTTLLGNSKVLPSFEETNLQSKGPSPDIQSTPEFRKSKSLTRKIKELSVREPRFDSPVVAAKDGLPTMENSLAQPSAAIGVIERTALVRSTSNNSGIIKPSNALDAVPSILKERERDLQPIVRESPAKVNPNQLNISSSPAIVHKNKQSGAALQTIKTAVPVPNLVLEKLNSSTASDKSELDDSFNSFYQHYALPKSLASGGGKSSTGGDLSARSSAAVAPASTVAAVGSANQIQKPKTKTVSTATVNGNYTEFILVENSTPPADVSDKAAENDRILQERLQQAKAMSRKDDNGATMHTFSLWKSKPQQQQQPQQQGNPVMPTATVASTVVAGTDGLELNGGLIAVGKYSTRLRGVTAIVEQKTGGNMNKENDDKGDIIQDSSFSLENNISMIKLDYATSHDYSDDDFVKDEESDSIIERSGGTAGDASTLSFNASKNLSKVLRSRIDDAKHFEESYTSSGGQQLANAGSQDRLIDDFDCSYGSLGGREESEKVSSSFDVPEPFTALETSIHHLEDDDMSVGSVEEDVLLAKELQKASQQIDQHHGSELLDPVHAMMSRSGPAAFLSPMALPSQVNGNSMKSAVQDDDSVGLHDARRASSGGLPIERSNGMQYEPIRLRSLTSRDMKENQHSRPSNVNNKPQRQGTANDENELKPSKYKVLKNLRQSNQRHSDNSNAEKAKEKLSKRIVESSAVLYTGNSAVAAATSTDPPSSNDVVDGNTNRDMINNSPLSELSETEDNSPLRTSLSKKSYLEELDINDGDAQCPSPLKWKKGEVIGEGTFGKVFKGLNEKTGELLAIKQIALADGSSGEVDELRQEINVMWDLDHPNIVRYMGTTKTDRYLFIIMEYVTGGSIASMLKQFGPFSESLFRRLAFHIISGVAYLHGKGIIHRDVKGANILVTDAGIAKLADFGCSKRMAGLCTASLEESMFALRGSVPWMAPEVIKQSGAGRSSDIWSVGATLIEMATGKPPWSEYSNNLATLFHVATSKDPPPIPSHLSESCADLISRCLVIDSEGRAAAQDLLNHPIFLPEVEKNPATAQLSLKKKKEGERSYFI